MTRADKQMVKSAFKLAFLRLAQLVSLLISTALCAYVVFHIMAIN